jgi:hypothetical protein
MIGEERSLCMAKNIVDKDIVDKDIVDKDIVDKDIVDKDIVDKDILEYELYCERRRPLSPYYGCSQNKAV